MRKSKAILSILLAFCLLLSTAVVAFAAEPENPSEFLVTIVANGVPFNITNPKEDDPSQLESGTCGGEANHYVPANGTLSSAQITVSHDNEHGNYFQGWQVHVDGNPLTDNDGNIRLLTTNEMQTYPITGNTEFSALWVGKYTSLNWITIHGNGGTFERTTTDSEKTEVRKMGYDSYPTPNDGTSLQDIGVSAITDPVYPDGTKTFEGWVAFYHGPTDNAFSAANDGGKTWTTAEILTYSNTKIGYTDFIAKWAGEDIDPNDCPIDETNELVSSTNNGGNSDELSSFSTIFVNANSGTFDYTDNNGATADFNVSAIVWDMQVGESLADIGVTKITDPVYWDGKREFEGWIPYIWQTVTYENGEEYEDWLPIQDEPLTSEEILSYPSAYDDIRFVAQWAGDDSDYFTQVNIDAMGGEFTVTDFDSDNNPINIWTTNGTGNICIQNGKPLADQWNISISDPVREGYTFEGWLAWTTAAPSYEMSTKLYTTEQILNELPVPEDDVTYLAKWKEIPMSEYLFGDPLNPDTRNFIAHGNGGNVTWTNLYDDGESETYIDVYLGCCSEDTRSFAESMKQDGITIESVEVNKEFSTFTGWTTYEADNLYYVYLAADETLTVSDPNFTVFHTYTSVEYDFSEYVVLENAKVYSETLTPMDVIEMAGPKHYYMFANWQDSIVSDVVVPGSDEEYKLEINPILSIPETAADKYKDTEEIKEALKNTAVAAAPSNVKEKNVTTEYYEITLKMKQVNEDGEEVWVLVTPENFPKEGLEVTIPYSKDMDPTKHKFIVTHLASSGDNAGEIEVLDHEVTTGGLTVMVYSFSPFAVTYFEPELKAGAASTPIAEPTATPAPTAEPTVTPAPTAEPTATPAPTAEPTATPAPTAEPTVTPAPTTTPSDVPQTGDESNVLLVFSVLILSAAGLIITFRKLRRE